MSTDPRSGPQERENVVARSRDKVTILRERDSDGPSNVVVAPVRPRLVEPVQHDTGPISTIAHAATWFSDVAGFAQRATAGLTLPRLKVSPLLATFVAFVLAPAFAAVIYFAFIASDQWTAEARFAVRSVEAEAADPSNNAGAGSSNPAATAASFSFTATSQNAYIVTSYIRSRAIVDHLNAKLNPGELFQRREADFWARLKREASIDELTEYWNAMVMTYIDGPSGIVTLQVRAFRANDAVTLGNVVLELSEALVNRISIRARRDSMEMAEKEVRRTYALTQAALADMRRFRDEAGIIDPAQAGTEIGKLLLPLLAEKVRLESDYFVARRDLDDNAPTIRVM